MKTLFDLATWLYEPSKEVGDAICDSELFTKITKTIADLKLQNSTNANLAENAIKIDELQEKAAIADQLQSDLINTDFGELRSERDYYRGILDKLCDRLKVVDIEALEHVAKYQEMSLDFTSQHNDNLAQQLAESQATSYKYVGRIVELENELRSLKELANGLQEKLIATKVMASKRLSRIAELEDKSRSLQEPVNTVGCGDDHVDSLRYFVDAFKPNALKNFDSDRLTTPELIQIIRSLLK